MGELCRQDAAAAAVPDSLRLWMWSRGHHWASVWYRKSASQGGSARQGHAVGRRPPNECPTVCVRMCACGDCRAVVRSSGRPAVRCWKKVCKLSVPGHQRSFCLRLPVSVYDCKWESALLVCLCLSVCACMRLSFPCVRLRANANLHYLLVIKAASTRWPLVILRQHVH